MRSPRGSMLGVTATRPRVSAATPGWRRYMASIARPNSLSVSCQELVGGTSTSSKIRSSTSWTSSSLLATYPYSDEAETPIWSATRRMVSVSPPSFSSTCSAASTTTSRLSCGLGTLRRRGADRHGGWGAV